MEKPNESVKILNMFLHPVFTVKDGIITDCNTTAAAKQIKIGTPISDLIPDSIAEYEGFTCGYLSLSIVLDDIKHLSTVIRSDDVDVFHLISADLSAEFRTMSLIAQQIRKPLSNILSATDALLPTITEHDGQDQANQISKNLYQILRLATNLSTAERFSVQQSNSMEMQSIPELIKETMEKAIALVDDKGKRLQFSGLPEDIEGIADADLLERAIYNLVSNALKFSPVSSEVHSKLIRNGNKLRFIIQNDIDENTDLSNLYARFMREPGIEDGRHGVGLGIPLVQYVASVHNGSLLMDQPDQQKVRFTLTIPIRQDAVRILRSPFGFFDYLGGHDHALVELSDVLPNAHYTEYL